MIGYVVTTSTELNLLSHSSDGFTEMSYFGLLLFKQMQDQSQCRFFAYTRQLGERGNR
jgi:hypothetical protein